MCFPFDLIQERIYLLSDNRRYSKPEMYLAFHAALSHKNHIPRLYLTTNTNPGVNPQSFYYQIFSQCAAIDIAVVKLNTDNIIKSIGIKDSELKRLNITDRSYLLEQTEEVLQDLCGTGKVYYCMIRFSPFATEDKAGEFAASYPGQHDHPGVKNFIHVLQKRNKDRERYLSEYSQICNAGKVEWGLTIFDLTYRDKVDAEWQKQWLSHTNYELPAEDTRLLHSISITEDI